MTTGQIPVQRGQLGLAVQGGPSRSTLVFSASGIRARQRALPSHAHPQLGTTVRRSQQPSPWAQSWAEGIVGRGAIISPVLRSRPCRNLGCMNEGSHATQACASTHRKQPTLAGASRHWSGFGSVIPGRVVTAASRCKPVLRALPPSAEAIATSIASSPPPSKGPSPTYRLPEHWEKQMSSAPLGKQRVMQRSGQSS